MGTLVAPNPVDRRRPRRSGGDSFVNADGGALATSLIRENVSLTRILNPTRGCLLTILLGVQFARRSMERGP